MCHPDQIVEMPLYAVDYRINWNMRTYPCEIDACLAPLLFKMNQKQGIVTTTSCCGHYGRNEGHIGIEVTSVYNAIMSGYDVVKEHRMWFSQEDGTELEADDYWIRV